jgi:hypothetical protein
MCVAVDTVLRRSVCFALIGVVEPSNVSLHGLHSRKTLVDSPVATIFVRRRSRPHHVRRARLANPAFEELRQNRDIENVAGVDKSARS